MSTFGKKAYVLFTLAMHNDAQLFLKRKIAYSGQYKKQQYNKIKVKPG